MITRYNAKTALNTIKSTDIETELNKKHDYVAVTLSGYGHIIIESVDWSEETEEECNSCGGFLCDKDNFLVLLDDVDHEYCYL